jgi:hypothetical protein
MKRIRHVDWNYSDSFTIGHYFFHADQTLPVATREP